MSTPSLFAASLACGRALTLKPTINPLLEFANATSLSVIAPTPLWTTVTSTSLVDNLMTEFSIASADPRICRSDRKFCH